MERLIHYFDYEVTLPVSYDEETEQYEYEVRQGVVAGSNYHEALEQIEEFYDIKSDPDTCVSIALTYHSVLVHETN